MSRPTLSYANVMSTIAVFLAHGGGAWAVTGQPAATKPPVTVTACVKKAGKAGGRLRVIAVKATCRKRERRLTWTSASRDRADHRRGRDDGCRGRDRSRGPAGPAGPRARTGAQGPAGAAGSGAATGDYGRDRARGAASDPRAPAAPLDTPAQILAKLSTVDGTGSGLDASLLDGFDSSAFLKTTGKAADADELDGINSTGFAQESPSSSGLISVGGIVAHSCASLDLTLGGVDSGDIVIVRPGASVELPTKGVIMSEGSTQGENLVHVRFCNVRHQHRPRSRTSRSAGTPSTRDPTRRDPPGSRQRAGRRAPTAAPPGRVGRRGGRREAQQAPAEGAELQQREEEHARPAAVHSHGATSVFASRCSTSLSATKSRVNAAAAGISGAGMAGSSGRCTGIASSEFPGAGAPWPSSHRPPGSARSSRPTPGADAPQVVDDEAVALPRGVSSASGCRRPRSGRDTHRRGHGAVGPGGRCRAASRCRSRPPVRR